MRVLCVTRLFPNRVEPVFGPFNKKQFAALADVGHEVTVINPIPTFPLATMFGSKTRASVRGIPAEDRIGGLPVHHPRFLHVPKVPMVHAPLYAAGIYRQVAKLKNRIDVIIAPFAYPDGIASVIVGQMLGVPVVIKLHGGDMNVGARIPQIGRWVRWGFERVDRIAAVSVPLAQAANEFGVPWSKIAVVEDGVDSTLFRIRDRAEAKREVGLPTDRRHIVYVGRLERRKGVYELMEAFEALMAQVPDVDLVLVGDGEDTPACKAWADKVGSRVILTGVKGMDEVAPYYAAADVATLPSHAEGTPNCIIEALACGRPVVASAVGGIPDMIHNRGMGELVPARDVQALTRAFVASLERTYDPEEIVRLTGRGTWQDSARCLADVLAGAAAR